jgi:hypothetical protein
VTRTVSRPARRRALAAGALAVVLATGAVGCGSGNTSESPKTTPVAAIAKAAKNTEKITSLRYRMTGEIPQQGRIKGEASMRLEPDLAVRMRMTALDQGQGGSAEVLFVDGTMYIGGNAELTKETGGKKWLKFDMSALSDQEMGLGAASGQVEQNPAAVSTFLTGAEDAREVGKEKVDGEQTTHYTGTVTLDTLRDSFKDLDDKTREQREQSLKAYETLGLEKVTMDLWVTEEELTKQFRIKGDAAQGPVDMTVTFLDWNKPVDVSAPATKDVADLAELFGGLEGGDNQDLGDLKS